MRTQYSYLIIALLCIAGVAACLLVLQRFPMLHDYPEWMYQGWIIHRLLEGHAAVTAAYEMVTYPVPNSLSQVFVGLLLTIVNPVTASKIWLGIYLVGAVVMCCHLWLRYQDSSQVLLLISVVILGPGFWNGYINFQYAVMLFGVYLLINSTYQQHFLIRLLWSLLIFFAHATVFGIFIIYCLATTWLDREKPVMQRIIRGTALLPSLILLLWYSLNMLTENTRDVAEAMGFKEWVQYKVYTMAKQGPFHNFILHNGEGLLERADWFYKIGFSVNFLFAILLILWFVWLVWVWLSERTLPVRLGVSSTAWALIITFFSCITVFMFTGSNTLGVVNLGERFLIVALMVALLCFKIHSRLKSLMTAFCGLFMIYLAGASVHLSTLVIDEYAMSRSSVNTDLTDYINDIYANTRHKYFNHRLFIYADRGVELLQSEPRILTIDHETSIVRRVP